MNTQRGGNQRRKMIEPYIMNRKRKRPSKEALMRALEDSSGIVYPVAQAYDVVRATVYEWIKIYDLTDYIEGLRDNLIDVIESKYIQDAINGKTRNQEFVLRTIGKKRGYVESQDITSNGETINSEVLNFDKLSDDELLEFNKIQRKLRGK
ncbi:MAG: hypothetical protein LBP67_05050 [Bacteroidales bacterium]|jgi:hypothetical protein|nr:hypothetical protein [Bacteroidales bacterium]